MRKKSTMKVARGRLEEDRRKSEDKFEYQRVMLFVLPLVIVAVLIVGIYFGYLSYKQTHAPLKIAQTTPVTTQIERTDEENDYLLTIVNSANTVDSSFVPQLSECVGVKVSSLVVDDLTLMLSDATADGVNIKLVSGYISYEEQKTLYEKAVKEHKEKNKSTTVKAEAAVKKTTPNAGECEQQTGLLVKFSSDDENFSSSKEYTWLSKNCVNYGFVLRYPDKENTGGMSFSADLFRYVGVENALSMRAYNMNLDEYVQYLHAQ